MKVQNREAGRKCWMSVLHTTKFNLLTCSSSSRGVLARLSPGHKIYRGVWLFQRGKIIHGGAPILYFKYAILPLYGHLTAAQSQHMVLQLPCCLTGKSYVHICGSHWIQWALPLERCTGLWCYSLIPSVIYPFLHVCEVWTEASNQFLLINWNAK